MPLQYYIEIKSTNCPGISSCLIIGSILFISTILKEWCVHDNAMQNITKHSIEGHEVTPRYYLRKNGTRSADSVLTLLVSNYALTKNKK